MARIQSQMDQRRAAKWKDQHGRPWFADVEKATGAPCQPFQPEFMAPVIPPKSYLKADPDIPGRVTINYGQWIADLRNADNVWWRDAQIIGSQEHKEHYDPTAPFSQTVINKAGERPRAPKCRTPINAKRGDAALPAIACLKGNAWVLGLAGPNGQKPKCPEALVPFFAKPVEALPDFDDVFEDESELEEVAPVARRGRGRPRHTAAPLATQEA